MIVTCRNCGSKCEIVDNYCRHCGALLELGSISGSENPFPSSMPNLPSIPPPGGPLPEPIDTIEPPENNTLLKVMVVLIVIMLIRLWIG
jgi:hypothetical protein